MQSGSGFRSDVPLADATVQEIQFELMRRSSFNEFDGPKVIASLERYRDLWIAAYMDRFGLYCAEHPDWFPSFSLIQLRDLRYNHWNVDTLVVLTESVEQARRLADVAKQEDWRADDLLVQENEEELSRALGVGPCPYRMLTAWWY